MSDFVKADGLVLYAKLGTNYYPIACGTSVSISTTTDKIELAPYQNSKWRSFIYGRTTGTITGSGLIKVAPTGNLYSPLDLIDYQQNHDIILAKYSVTDPQNNSRNYEVACLIDDVTLSADAGGTATYNFTLSMTGNPQYIQTPVDTGGDNVQAWDYTAIGGETSISDSVLVNNEVVDVRRNGIGLEVIFAGIPTGSQVKFSDNTGILEFGFPLGEGEYILVIYVD
jgi:hypothetical protein